MSLLFPGITYQPILGDVWYVSQGDLKVVMNRSTGFVNVTHLCELANKRFPDWLAHPDSKNVISLFKQRQSKRSHKNGGTLQLENPDDTLLTKDIADMVKSDADARIRGVFLHYDLIQFVARWISPEFELTMFDIIHDYLIRKQDARTPLQKEQDILQEKDRLAMITANYQKALDEKQRELDRLNSKLVDLNVEWEQQLTETTAKLTSGLSLKTEELLMLKTFIKRKFERST